MSDTTIKSHQAVTFVMLLHERIEKANPLRELTAEESKRFHKFEAISEKLKRGEDVRSSVGVTHYLHTNYFEVLND